MSHHLRHIDALFTRALEDERWSGVSFSTRARRSRSIATADPDLLIQHFKDDATAFNAQKRGTIVDKGVLNNRMSEVLFRFLEAEGVADALRARACPTATC